MSRNRRDKKLWKFHNISESNSNSDDSSEEVYENSDQECDFSVESSDTGENSATESSEEETTTTTLGTKKRTGKVLNDSIDEELDVAADGTIWEPINVGRVAGRPQFAFHDKKGPTPHAKRNVLDGSAFSAFSLIITKQMIRHIRKCTEEEASRKLGRKYVLTENNLYKFIAILYARGAYEAKNLSVVTLWNKTWGPLFFTNTMPRNMFTEIMKFIRFDLKTTRSERLKTDKFAMASFIWYEFIKNSLNAYVPGENLTIDEQLFPSKSRCRFTQYMANKPDKFGIKFWLACDVDSKYIFNGFPYLGKDERRPSNISLGEFVVSKLVEPIFGSNRNITADNFFSCTSLAEKLLQKRLSYVGTVRSNRRFLPKLAKIQKDKMDLRSTKLYKTSNSSLTIYKAKKNKKVLILSTKHKSVGVSNDEKKLPDTISFYNKTKFGVDVADQMARKFSVKAKCNRWPVHVFFNVLDLAAINAWILYKETADIEISRQDFLFQLASELASMDENLDSSSQTTQSAKNVQQGTSTDPKLRPKCQIRFCNENKTTKTCSKCGKFTCGFCEAPTSIICKKC